MKNNFFPLLIGLVFLAVMLSGCNSALQEATVPSPTPHVFCNSSDPVKLPVTKYNVAIGNSATNGVTLQNGTGGPITIDSAVPSGDFETLNTTTTPDTGKVLGGGTIIINPVCDSGKTICKSGHNYNGNITINYTDQFGSPKTVEVTCSGTFG